MSSKASSSELHGRSLTLVRAGWAIFVLVAFAIFVASIPIAISLLGKISLPERSAWLFYDYPFQIEFAIDLTSLLVSLLGTLACFGLGALIVWRKPTELMSWLVSFILISVGVTMTSALDNLTTFFPSALSGVRELEAVLLVPAIALLLYLFPDGRFVPRWARWCGLWLIPWSLLTIYFQILPAQGTGTTTLWFIVPWYLINFIGLPLQVYRYRHVSTPEQTQQTKWVLFGLTMWVLLMVSSFLVYFFLLPLTSPGPLQITLFFFSRVSFPVALLIVPVSLGFSILRYRLWDIDVIIRRTLTYALVTALLAVVFFGSVIVLQQVFAGVTGSGQNEIVTVLSTLAIAALFVPLRNWVQGAIDRRFNRKKYDAQQVLSDFANTVRDETDLEKLTARLMQVVDETMQPKSVSVWLKRDDGRRAARENK